MDGTLQGDAQISEQRGALGLCMEFDGEGDYVDCGNLPIYDQVDGIRLEAYVRPANVDADGDPDTDDLLGVIGKYAANDPGDDNDDEGYVLALQCTDGEGAGRYRVYARIGTDDETVEVGSGDVRIPGYAWSHVTVEHDGVEVRLYVNGVQVAEEDLDERIDPARGENLHIGHYEDGADYYFEGQIDEPLLLAVAGGERVYLPDRVPLVTSDEVVHFDAQGYLDLGHHAGPVYLAVGDPHQSAELAEDIVADDLTLTLRPRNPFPPTGGLVMVGNQTDGYELIRYDSADVEGLTLAVAATEDRGIYGTSADTHAEGQTVYFARVVRVGHTGIVSKGE
jgi:hypothetical protein